MRSSNGRSGEVFAPGSGAVLDAPPGGPAQATEVSAQATEAPAQATDPVEFPCSYAQERLWFLDQLDPGSPENNVPVAFRIGGPLNIAALRDALGEVITRHEILRTSFHASDGIPVQRIHAPSSPELPFTDLSGYPDPAHEADRIIAEEAIQQLDLERGPLLCSPTNGRPVCCAMSLWPYTRRRFTASV